MAKYTITHTCGHQTEVALFGPDADRARRIAAMEQDHCVACRAAGSNLTGSPKQIAWAEDIRATAMPRIMADIAGLRAQLAALTPAATATPEQIATAEANRDACLAEIDRRETAIIGETTARAWIDGIKAPTMREIFEAVLAAQGK